jgi:hypothetical protein
MLEPLCAPADVETARMISLAWLRHALEGSLYPLDPHLENLAYAPGYRFVFGAGGFATMPKPMQQRLKDYLIAMVSDDADEAAASLAAASGRQVPETVFEELRRQFRQMAPFRDGFRNADFGDPDGDGRRFTEELLIHWRIASELGLTEGTPLTAFFRALLTMLRTAGQLSPGYDPLPDALRDLRLLSALGLIQDVMRPAEMSRLIESYATAMPGMPEQTERLLTAAGFQWTGGQVDTRYGPSGRDDSSIVPFSLMLAMTGIALVLQKIPVAWGATFDRVSAVALLVLGFCVLRTVGRDRGTAKGGMCWRVTR